VSTSLVTAYWWNERPNYGDTLTPLLLDRFSDLNAMWAPAEFAEIIVVGSILEHLPKEWNGMVLGAGKLKQFSDIDLAKAKILGLRGKLTAAKIKGDYALGDPGLLASELVDRPHVKTVDLCIVPHWSDNVLADKFAHIPARDGLENIVVDPTADSLTVIKQIASAEKVVSSSLHGIIIADSFKIPRRAEKFPNMVKPYEGGEFKWHDYASVLDEPMIWGEMHQPDERKIEQAQAELFDAFRSLVPGETSKPWWRKRTRISGSTKKHEHDGDD
jgi:hypothetical protein